MYPGVFSLDIMDAIVELDFAVKVFVFAYLLFWLYTTFGDQQILFGLGASVAFFFLFFYGLPTIAVVVLFFAVFMFGSIFQQLIMFGIIPALNIVGIKAPQIGASSWELEQMHLQEVERKIMKGQALSGQEQELYRQHLQMQMRSEQMRQQTMQKGSGR